MDRHFLFALFAVTAVFAMFADVLRHQRPTEVASVHAQLDGLQNTWKDTIEALGCNDVICAANELHAYAKEAAPRTATLFTAASE